MISEPEWLKKLQNIAEVACFSPGCQGGICLLGRAALNFYVLIKNNAILSIGVSPIHFPGDIIPGRFLEDTEGIRSQDEDFPKGFLQHLENVLSMPMQEGIDKVER